MKIPRVHINNTENRELRVGARVRFIEDYDDVKKGDEGIIKTITETSFDDSGYICDITMDRGQQAGAYACRFEVIG